MTQAKGKQRKGFQDSIGIEEYRGKYRLNLTHRLTRIYYPNQKSNKRIPTGLTVCPENQGKVEQTAWTIHYDILAGNFDVTLVKYGLVELSVVEPIKQKQMSLLELYDLYCESRKGSVAETTLELKLKRRYRRAITNAIDNTKGGALAIRNYLVENHNAKDAKECLRHLDKAYQLGFEHKVVDDNPFKDMANKIKLSSKKGINQDDNDGSDDTRAFSIDEMNAIISAFETSKNRQYYAPIIKFLFWTGCRTGEAIALKWRDIKWDNEIIAIRRTYNEQLNLFKPTKTGIVRFFPMPKDSQLWSLLKSLPERNSDDVVFPSKAGVTLNFDVLARMWRGDSLNRQPGIIPELIAEGKVKQYLKPYATRHTFISHQVNIHKIPITTVAQWVGNGAMVSNNSYLDRDRMTVPGYSDVSLTQQEEIPPSDSIKEITDSLANLTPEQIEKLKTLLSQM